jgi:hypothetical protein
MNSKGTGKKPLSPSNLSPEDDRISIKVPKKSKIYQYLNGDKTFINTPKWKRLDALLSVAEQTQEDLDTAIFDAFVGTLGKLHPDKIDKLKRLRPFILYHILWDEALDDDEYEKLKEL